MQEINSISVNPNVLKWAREMLVLSISKAAEESKINARRLSQLESGEKQPTLDELRSLSKSYKRTIATLLLNEPPEEKSFPRDCRTVNSEVLNVFHIKSIMAIRKARALLTSFVELKQELEIPINQFLMRASLNDSTFDISKRIRQILNLDEVREFDNINLALEAYTEKLESAGIAVFQLSLTEDNLRGFSIVDEIIPIIVIKRGDDPSAKIFTLFHELGHILLNEGGMCEINFSKDSQQIEKWCNALSAEILIPSDELLNKPIVKDYDSKGLKIWTKEDLITLAKDFHVGPLAMLRRLLEHDLTSEAFYNEKHNLWNKPRFGRSKKPEGRNIPKETIKEKGRTYISLAFRAYDLNRINLKDLSDFLGIKLSYISKTRQLLSTI